MGLSIVGVFVLSGTMSTASIVEQQAELMRFQIPFTGIEFNPGIPGWYGLLLIPSMIIYGITMVGETNRAPFDLPECESELVAGYMTEYSGFRYALFFLAEYINMATVSALAVTLFLGGYLPPWPLNLIPFLADNAWFGPIFFFIKVQLLFSGFVWLRGTLPRFRYDQLMDLGWKKLIPISLLWIVMIAIAPGYTLPLAILLLAILIALGGTTDEDDGEEIDTDEPFDAFAGGYPVPPRPGQQLPEMAGVVRAPRTDDTPAGEEF